MGGHLKRRIAGVAISGALIAGVVAVTSMSASGQTFMPASGPVLRDYGTLTIGLNSATGQYRAVLDPVAIGADDIVQTIGATQPCATVTPGVGTLLRFAPTPGSTTVDTVQIRNDALGVNTSNTSCGSSAAAVISGSPLELLKIDLGSTLSGLNAPVQVFAKSAVLQLTRVKSGNPTLGFDGGSQGEAIPFSGTVNVAPEINSADDLFTSITIGSDSNKAGDGVSVATNTRFTLVTLDPSLDVAVDCFEFVADASTLPGDVATNATYQRLDNKAGTNDCEEVGVRVEIQPASGSVESRVFWNNASQGVNGGSTQNVQAYFTIVWKATNDLGRLNRDIDYDGDGAQTAEKMRWCAGTVDGVPVLPSSVTGVGINIGSKTLADGTVTAADWRAPWCLVEDERVLQADGKIVQTQKLFGSGDPWAR